MNCEVDGRDGTRIIGRMYPQGNLNGERGTPIRIKTDPTVHYFNVLPTGERVPMEHNLETGQSRVINIPQL